MLNTLLFQGILVSDPNLTTDTRTDRPVVRFRLIGEGSKRIGQDGTVNFLFIAKEQIAKEFASRFKQGDQVSVKATLEQRVYDDEQETVLYYATVRKILDNSADESIKKELVDIISTSNQRILS